MDSANIWARQVLDQQSRPVGRWVTPHAIHRLLAVYPLLPVVMIDNGAHFAVTSVRQLLVGGNRTHALGVRPSRLMDL